MSEGFPPDPRREKTAIWMNNPAIGMEFSEMYSYYVTVVDLPDNRVVVREAHPPAELPRDGIIREFDSAEAFREYYAYGGDTAGYWISANEVQDTRDWYDYAVEHGNTVVTNGERIS